MDVGASPLGLIGGAWSATLATTGLLTSLFNAKIATQRIADLIIATWNINSIRQRIGHLTGYLRDVAPDVLCLQEIKCQDKDFPAEAIAECGYCFAVHGQKTFNGVAILSKQKLEDIQIGLPGDDSDEQARYLEGSIAAGGRMVRVASIYLPNGNPPDTDKYSYKLAWMDRLIDRAKDLLAAEEPLVLAGDYNVIPEARDARYPQDWTQDALHLPKTLAQFARLKNLGLTEALRATTDAEGLYTFWDYQAGAWQKNNGIRIDHHLLSAQAADLLRSVTIDKNMRAAEKPSDHVPIRIELDL
jgi:exodeoxyribonuclease III